MLSKLADYPQVLKIKGARRKYSKMEENFSIIKNGWNFFNKKLPCLRFEFRCIFHYTTGDFKSLMWTYWSILGKFWNRVCVGRQLSTDIYIRGCMCTYCTHCIHYVILNVISFCRQLICFLTVTICFLN